MHLLTFRGRIWSTFFYWLHFCSVLHTVFLVKSSNSLLVLFMTDTTYTKSCEGNKTLWITVTLWVNTSVQMLGYQSDWSKQPLLRLTGWLAWQKRRGDRGWSSWALKAAPLPWGFPTSLLRCSVNSQRDTRQSSRVPCEGRLRIGAGSVTALYRTLAALLIMGNNSIHLVGGWN